MVILRKFRKDLEKNELLSLICYNIENNVSYEER